MIYFEKSQPAPDCLAVEKTKASGDYKCGDVLDRLQTDFMNKCYLCEQKSPTSIQVEHFVPHERDRDLKFDWNNLFFSCAHCNNTKLAIKNLIDCTKKDEAIERRLIQDYNLVENEASFSSNSSSDIPAENTAELLNKIFAGHTKLKKLEASNLREKVKKELINFIDLLDEYTSNPSASSKALLEADLKSSSAFTGFKRHIARGNGKVSADFADLLRL